MQRQERDRQQRVCESSHISSLHIGRARGGQAVERGKQASTDDRAPQEFHRAMFNEGIKPAHGERKPFRLT